MSNNLIRRLFNGSFFRFLCVGVFNTIIGYGLMVLLYNIVKLPYWPSTFLANSVGATVSYFLNREITFKSNVNKSESILKFVLVILICYFISYYLGSIITRYFFINIIKVSNEKIIGNISILFGMCMYTITNYLGQKLFVFKK